MLMPDSDGSTNCAVLTDGTVKCFGQTGGPGSPSGTTYRSSAFTTALSSVTKIAAGFRTLFLHSDGSVDSYAASGGILAAAAVTGDQGALGITGTLRSVSRHSDIYRVTDSGNRCGGEDPT